MFSTTSLVLPNIYSQIMYMKSLKTAVQTTSQQHMTYNYQHVCQIPHFSWSFQFQYIVIYSMKTSCHLEHGWYFMLHLQLSSFHFMWLIYVRFHGIVFINLIKFPVFLLVLIMTWRWDTELGKENCHKLFRINFLICMRRCVKTTSRWRIYNPVAFISCDLHSIWWNSSWNLIHVLVGLSQKIMQLRVKPSSNGHDSWW